MSDKEKLNLLEQMYGYIESESFIIQSVHFDWLLRQAEIAVYGLKDDSQQEVEQEQEQGQKNFHKIKRAKQERVYFHKINQGKPYHK